jgi:hypothetical protein
VHPHPLILSSSNRVVDVWEGSENCEWLTQIRRVWVKREVIKRENRVSFTERESSEEIGRVIGGLPEAADPWQEPTNLPCLNTEK